MTWLRIDDSFIDHPKLVSLGGPAVRWAYLELLTYCARHRTEGYLPNNLLTVLPRATTPFLNKCLEVGLIDRTETGDFRVHDWETYNPSQKDPTGAVRQQRWRNAQRNGRVTENVTDDVTPSRARAPVPSPTPRTQEPSSLPLQGPAGRQESENSYTPQELETLANPLLEDIPE